MYALQSRANEKRIPHRMPSRQTGANETTAMCKKSFTRVQKARKDGRTITVPAIVTIQAQSISTVLGTCKE